MKRASHISWLVFFVLLSGVFFYKTLFRFELPVPSDALVGLYHPWRDLYEHDFPRGVPFKNFLITDPVRQQIPWRKLVIDSWRSGRLPGWNPYVLAGAPLDANIQAAPFYPFNILFFIIPFSAAWTILILLQPAFAGLFMYAYLRNRKRSRMASLLGACAWSFSGFGIAWMTWGTIVHTALWLPLALLSIDKLMDARHVSGSKGSVRRWSCVFALSLVMTITGGHMQIAMYSCIAIAGYLIWIVQNGGDRKRMRWVGAACFAAVVVTAVQWVPIVQFLPQTGRINDQEVWNAAGWFLPLQHLVQFIAPDFFGNPATMNYWGIWNYGEFIGYIGIVPLIFALSALFAAGVPMFFSSVFVIGLILMIQGPISRLPFALHVPLLAALQPTRLMFLVDVSLAVLAAYGFDALSVNRRRFVRVCVMIGGMLAAMWVVSFVGAAIWKGALPQEHMLVARRNMLLPSIIFVVFAGWCTLFRRAKKSTWYRIGHLMLLGIVVCDLFRFGWKFIPFTKGEYFFPVTKTLSFLQSEKTPFRTMSLDDRILPPNTGSYYRIESIEGYDPMVSKRYEDFMVASERGKADLARPTGFHRIFTAHAIDSPLLPYMNVRYVLSISDVSRPFLRKVSQEGSIQLYRYTNELPRVYLADHIKVLTTAEEILDALIDTSPARIGIVEHAIPILSVPVSPDESVEIISYGTDAVQFRSVTANARLVVVLNSYDARWKATVDGKKTDIVRANYLFSGVVVPRGSHIVSLSYRY